MNSRRDWRALAPSVRQADYERRYISLIFYIFVPIAVAALGAFSPALFALSPFVGIGAWIVILVLYSCLWWIIRPSDRAIISLMREIDRLRDQLKSTGEREEKLEGVIAYFSWFTQFSLATTRMIASYGTNGMNSADELTETISDMFYPVLANAGLLFGTNGTEHWTFAVYLYRKSTDVLEPVWVKRSPYHPSTGASRTWGRGEGHVGKTFVNRQAIITSDTHHKDVRPLSATSPEKAKTFDNDAYRSFVSIPIGPTEEGSAALPAGVLVATSSEVARFDQANTPVLEQLAEALATILNVKHIDSAIPKEGASLGETNDDKS